MFVKKFEKLLNLQININNFLTVGIETFKTLDISLAQGYGSGLALAHQMLLFVND